MDLEKIKQRMIEGGFLTLLGHIDIHLKNEDSKQLFQRELWALLEGEDFNLHFQKSPRPCEPFLSAGQQELHAIDTHLRAL